MKEDIKEDLKAKGLLKDKPKAEQQTLFGETDFVFNALHSELTEVNVDIANTQSSIEKKEKMLGELEERQGKLNRALGIVRKQRNELKPKKEPADSREKATKK